MLNGRRRSTFNEEKSYWTLYKQSGTNSEAEDNILAEKIQKLSKQIPDTSIALNVATNRRKRRVQYSCQYFQRICRCIK